MVDAAQMRAETAKSLRDAAHQLLADTGLFQMLQERFGDPWVTGSAGYDLMTWRDIDIHMAVEADRAIEWMGFGQEMAQQLNDVGFALHKATYLNDYVDPHPLGAGLYWGLEFKDLDSAKWNMDIWGWDPFDYAVRQARDFTLRTDLQACDRDLILRLKTEARLRPNYYGNLVTSFDIYRFCIAQAGDSLGALEKWKREQAQTS
jgi:hypothetical protein